MERCAVKKFVAFCLAFMVVTLCVAWVRIAKETAESPKSDIVVVLDAGHGGIDGGVTGIKTGVKESELNLKICKVARKIGNKSRYDENGRRRLVRLFD